MDRQQSWNEQDMKRKFQERLLRPVRAGGFSSGGGRGDEQNGWGN